MHLGFLCYWVAQAGQRFVLEGEKSDHGFGLCMQMSVWNIVCAGGLIFFHFPCFWGIVKSGQIFSPITQMRLLFLAQWGLTLIRQGTKCCFSSCLAVWGLKEVKEGRGKTGSSGDFKCLSRYRGPTTVSYLFDVFLSKKMISFLLIFFLFEDVQYHSLSNHFSSSLHLLFL